MQPHRAHTCSPHTQINSGLKPKDPEYIGAVDPTTPNGIDLRSARVCEVRLVGAENPKVGNTLTSKCVTYTVYTVYDYTSFSDFSGAGAHVGSFSGFHLVHLNGTSSP